MKIKYNQIEIALNSLSEFLDKEMNYSLALKISRNLSELEKHYMDYREERQKLADKYLDRDENGNFIYASENSLKVKDGMAEEFSNNLRTLDEFEVEVNVYMLQENEFADVKITPSILMGIDFLIDNGEIKKEGE